MRVNLFKHICRCEDICSPHCYLCTLTQTPLDFEDNSEKSVVLQACIHSNMLNLSWNVLRQISNHSFSISPSSDKVIHVFRNSWIKQWSEILYPPLAFSYLKIGLSCLTIGSFINDLRDDQIWIKFAAVCNGAAFISATSDQLTVFQVSLQPEAFIYLFQVCFIGSTL